MKRILYISQGTGKVGAVHSLIALCSYVKKKKEYEILVVIPGSGPIEEFLKQQDIPYMIRRFVSSVDYGQGRSLLRGAVKYIVNQYQSFGLKRFLKKQKIEISLVHSNTFESDFGCFVSQRLKVPHIWHIREFGKYDFNSEYELGIRHFAKCAEKADKIICISNSVAAYYRKILDSDKITVIYNGVKVKGAVADSWDGAVFKMVFVGRISKEKNQEMAVRACKKMLDAGLGNFILDLYGDDNDTEKIKNLIAELGLEEKVRMMGYQPDVPVHEYHVGIICSRCEAFGRVTAEYMAGGIPVIGTNTGGTAELIEDGKTGILLKENTAENLYHAIERLYFDRKLCREMGENGYKAAKEKYTEERYCADVCSVYAEVLQPAHFTEKGFWKE